MATHKAFVSSTFTDLMAHRSRVINHLRQAGFLLDPMEEWTSDPMEPQQFSLERVAGCDLCVLLIAFRRGFVPDGAHNSITQMEYEHAVKNGIDVLCFLLDEKTHSWPAAFDERHDPHLQQWRRRVTKLHGIALFTEDPLSLDTAVPAALTRWLRRRQDMEMLQAYLASIRRTHGFVRLLGLPKKQELEDIPIDRLFVQPILMSEKYDIEPTTRYSVLEALQAFSSLVILGDPGAGKSTIIDWLVWQLCDPHPNCIRTTLAQSLPLPFVLRDMGIRERVTWDELLAAFYTIPQHRSLNSDSVLSALTQGKALLLFDGLDEIGNIKARKDLRDAIWKGMKLYPDCRWILTSRIVGYDDAAFDYMPAVSGEMDQESRERVSRRTRGPRIADRRMATVLHVAPFNDDQIARFAHNWYAQREADTHRAHRGAEDFISAVQRDNSVVKLARIPNLLTIMALIHRIKATLPNGKALLYEDIAEAYLESIDGYRKIREDSDGLRDKKRWLGRIAFEMQTRRTSHGGDNGAGILAGDGELCAWLLFAMNESGREADKEDATQFLDRIRRRSGLMIDRAAGQFSFTHLSFQEYFAALYLKEAMADWLSGEAALPRAGPEDLCRYAKSELWHEVLVFLFELAAEERAVWKRRLWAAVFGEWDDTSLKALEISQVALHLLVRLVSNPHVKWDDELIDKTAIICLKWQAEMQQSSPLYYTCDAASMSDLILRRSARNLERRWKILIEAYERIRARRLNLGKCEGVPWPAIVGRLRHLEEIYIRGAEAEELSVLKELPELRVLAVGSRASSTRVEELRRCLPNVSVIE